MNNRKTMLRKIVAFVSALSFVAISNYTSFSAISEEIIDQSTAVTDADDKTSEDTSKSDDHTSNLDDEEQNPDDLTPDPGNEEQNPNDLTPDLGNEEQNPDAVEPEDNENQDQLTKEIGIEFSLSVDDTEKKIVIETLCSEIQKILSSTNYEAMHDDEKISISYISDDDLKKIIDALKSRTIEFAYNLKSKYYCYKINEDASYISMEEFYALSDKHSANIQSVEVKADDVLNTNNRNYVKSGTVINIEATDGYHFDSNSTVSYTVSLNVNGAVHIIDNAITMGGAEKATIEENTVNLKFNIEGDASVFYSEELVNAITDITWSELERKTIRFRYKNNVTLYLEGEPFYVGSDQEYSLINLLSIIGINKTNCKHNATCEFDLEAVPDGLEATYNYFNQDGTKYAIDPTEIKTLISDKKVNIPYVVTKTIGDIDKTFYLNGYAYFSNGELKFSNEDDDGYDMAYIYSQLAGENYYDTSLKYFNGQSPISALSIKYVEVPSESEIDTETIKEAILTTKDSNREFNPEGNMTGKRNDNVYTLKKTNEKILFQLGNDSDFADKSFLIIDDNSNFIMPKTELVTPEDETELEYYSLALEARNSKFLKFIVLNEITLDESTGEETLISSAAFKEPFYVYFDQTAPIVTAPYADAETSSNDITVTDSYADTKEPAVNPEPYKNTNGWSNETNSSGYGIYQFNFDASDVAVDNLESISSELRETYEKINDNPNLNSVSSITIGDYVFNRPSGGWNSKTSISGSLIEGVNSDYSLVLYPDIENKVFSGKFKAVLTLKEENTNYSDDLSIQAVDDCGNFSNEQNITVKIDINAPVVNEITIDNLSDGYGLNKVLENRSHEERSNLIVKADITDKIEDMLAFSGIQSVAISYGDEEKEVVNDIRDGKYYAEFEVKEMNLDSVVRIVVTDNAGNERTVYYSEDEASSVTEDKDNAVHIIADNAKPEIDDITLSDPNYSEETRKWYNTYPDINFMASDKGEYSSGLKTVTFKINGVEVEDIEVDEELLEEIQSGETYLQFIPTDTNNQQFIAYLCYDGEDVETQLKLFKKGSTEDIFSLNAEGQLLVSIIVTDYAGNNSDERTVDIYIDNNNPSSDSKFKVVNDENNKVRQAKYGTFANHQFTLAVQISDTKDNVPSSGYKEAILTYNGETYKASISVEDNTASFNIPNEIAEHSAVEGEMNIIVTDNVGNKSTLTVLSSTDEKGNSSVVGIENIKPVISNPVITGENLYLNGNGESWYSSDITVSYSISDKESDADSGLAEAYYHMQNDGITEPVQKIEKNYTDRNKKTLTSEENEFTLTTAADKDGLYTFSMTVYDNAGNADVHFVDVYKDINKPYISGFKFDRYNEAGGNVVMGERFDYFYDDSTVLIVSAKDDRGASAGIQTIYCVLYNTDGSVFRDYSASDLDLDNGVYSASFLIPEGFKGDIKAWVMDNVKNTSEQTSPDGFVSENEGRHNATADLDIKLPETSNTDINGLPLYNEDITAQLTATDSFSGIRSIEWLTSDFSDWESTVADSNGNIASGGWSVNSTERNIVTDASNSITVSSDANSDFIRLKITDNSGNVIETSESFSIDKVAPVIDVTGLENAEQSQDTVYYASDVTAYITITERNFQAPLINEEPESGFQADSTSLEGTDGYRHTLSKKYDTDGEYQLEIKCTDLAGNEAEKYSSGKFIIDKTAPVRDLHFYRNSDQSIEINPDTESHINSTVNAVLSITDANFNPEDVTITINGENYEHNQNNWQTSGGSSSTDENTEGNSVEKNYTLNIPETVFHENGVYKITISGKDLAGNPLEEYTKSFEIDTIAPEITMSGFVTANKGEVAPVIEYTDRNIEEYTLALYRNNELCPMDEIEGYYQFKITDGIYVTGKWETVIEGEQFRFIFDNFPKDEVYDGIYDIEASIKDKADNAQEQTSRFSVNRFGSTFIIEEEEKVNGKYLNKPPTVVITEINVDKHKNNSDVITIVDKGSSTVQLTDQDYSFPKEPELLEDYSGYSYTYTIVSQNFEQDLDYQVTIRTLDAAGTQNVSTDRGGDLGFIVDTHPPQYECDNLEANMEFRGSGMTFTLNANEKLQRIQITSEGQTLLDHNTEDDAEIENNSYTFTVPASNNARSITIKLIDLAGNVSTKTIDNLLVTESWFAYLWHKTWVRLTGIGSLIGIGALTGVLASIRRKKKNRSN